MQLPELSDRSLHAMNHRRTEVLCVLRRKGIKRGLIILLDVLKGHLATITIGELDPAVTVMRAVDVRQRVLQASMQRGAHTFLDVPFNGSGNCAPGLFGVPGPVLAYRRQRRIGKPHEHSIVRKTELHRTVFRSNYNAVSRHPCRYAVRS